MKENIETSQDKKNQNSVADRKLQVNSKFKTDQMFYFSNNRLHRYSIIINIFLCKETKAVISY